MKYWLKKIFILSAIIFIVGIYTMPVFAQELKTYCWPKDACESAKGVWAGDSGANFSEQGTKDCIQSPVKYNFCYPKEAEVKLQVPIGGLTNTSTLLNYIPNLYTYAVSIVSIVAVIMIMVGGLRYLTAGGAQDKVTSAKNTILGAVVGLFLVFGANLLLRTVNPDLVTLKLPQVKMIAPQTVVQSCANQKEYKCGVRYTQSSNPKAPNGVSYCDGQFCESPVGWPEKGCFKTSYDATVGQCEYLGAGKACDAIKKLGDGCLNTSFFGGKVIGEITLDKTCHAQGMITLPKKAMDEAKIKYEFINPSGPISGLVKIFTISDENGNKFTIEDWPIIDDGINFRISTCKGGLIGCSGPAKQEIIDPLCKWFTKLPPKSRFFNIF